MYLCSNSVKSFYINIGILCMSVLVHQVGTALSAIALYLLTLYVCTANFG